MGVQLDENELTEFLEQSHTMILSTVRQSGEPFLTPLWYVYMDGAIFFRTPSDSAKVKHIKRDPRVCCLIEEGEQWLDLKAVVLTCDAHLVDHESMEFGRFRKRFNQKYELFRPRLDKAPDATKAHYSSGSTLVKLTPRDREIRSWYNRKIRGFE